MKKQKHNLKKTRILKLAMMALFFAMAMACNKDDGPKLEKFSPSTPQGNNIVISYPDGTNRPFSTIGVFGWVTRNLTATDSYLEDYRQQVRVGDFKSGLIVRFNVPGGTKEEDVLGKKHKLNPVRFNDKNYGQLNEIYPEIFVAEGDAIFGQNNATGSIEIFKTNSYDIIGYINAELKNKNNELLKIEGHFWLDKATPWTNNIR